MHLCGSLEQVAARRIKSHHITYGRCIAPTLHSANKKAKRDQQTAGAFDLLDSVSATQDETHAYGPSAMHYRFPRTTRYPLAPSPLSTLHPCPSSALATAGPSTPRWPALCLPTPVTIVIPSLGAKLVGLAILASARPANCKTFCRSYHLSTASSEITLASWIVR